MVLDAATGSGTSPAIITNGVGTTVVHSHRLSTVVPSSVTEAADHELADADLLHKLHYLRAPAPGEAALSVHALKEPMSPWLDRYFPVAGRLRRRSAGEGAEAAVRAVQRRWRPRGGGRLRRHRRRVDGGGGGARRAVHGAVLRQCDRAGTLLLAAALRAGSAGSRLNSQSIWLATNECALITPSPFSNCCC
jgi:hypothetical protein